MATNWQLVSSDSYSSFESSSASSGDEGFGATAECFSKLDFSYQDYDQDVLETCLRDYLDEDEG